MAKAQATKTDLFGVDTSSGLLTNLTGTISEAYFGTDPAYMDGEVAMLFFELTDCTTTDEDQDGDPLTVTHSETKEEGDFQVRYTIGKKFQVQDGGASCFVPGKPTQLFQQAAMMGIIVSNISGAIKDLGSIDATFSDDGKKVALDYTGLMETLTSNADPDDPDPRVAATWEGITFLFRECHLDYGGDISTNKLLPVTYLPNAAKPAKAKATKAKADPETSAMDQKIADAKAAKAAEAGGLAAAVAGAGGSDATTKALTKALKAAEDHEAFVSLSIEIDEIVTNDELLELLRDEEGFWSYK